LFCQRQILLRSQPTTDISRPGSCMARRFPVRLRNGERIHPVLPPGPRVGIPGPASMELSQEMTMARTRHGLFLAGIGSLLALWAGAGCQLLPTRLVSAAGGHGTEADAPSWVGFRHGTSSFRPNSPASSKGSGQEDSVSSEQ